MQTMLEAHETITSWGITNIKIGDDIISFDVCGFKFEGCVLIQTIDYGYDVYLDNELKAHCECNNIVSCLDSLVEHTDNYEDDLFNWIIVNNKVISKKLTRMSLRRHL